MAEKPRQYRLVVPVEAIQIDTGKQFMLQHLMDWGVPDFHGYPGPVTAGNTWTLEGVNVLNPRRVWERANHGDYIVKLSDRNFHVVPKEEFEKDYEEIQ